MICWQCNTKIPYNYYIISPLRLVIICLIHFGACMLGIYEFTFVISFLYTDPFIIVQWPSLSHYTFWFVYFVCYKNGFVPFFWFSFAWTSIIHPFTVSLCVSLELKSPVVSFFFFFFKSIWPLCAFGLVRSIHLHLGWLLICKKFTKKINKF